MKETEDLGIRRFIGLKVPRTLEGCLNYTGKSRWVALYRDEDIGQATRNEIVAFDGANGSAGHFQALMLLANQSPELLSCLQALNAATDSDTTANKWLLLDRHDRNLYLGEREAIEILLVQPQIQKLLLEVDRDRPKQFGPYRTAAKIAGVIILAAALLGGLGYGLYWGVEEGVITLSTNEPAKPEAAISPQIPNQDNPTVLNDADILYLKLVALAGVVLVPLIAAHRKLHQE